jgi:hypothetical protein
MIEDSSKDAEYVKITRIVGHKDTTRKVFGENLRVELPDFG